MNEQEIADSLKQNIPEEPVHTPAPELPPETGADKVMPTHLDEFTQYKLHDFFGESYKRSNDVLNHQSEYIFNKVAELIGSSDYTAVLSQIIELERMIGTAHSTKRMSRLYQWLRLNSVHQSVEQQMRNLRYAE